MNDTTTRCPHCGAEPLGEAFTGYPNASGVAILKQRSCGSVIDTLYPEKESRTELCREREERQKLEAEVARLKSINADMRNFLSKAIHNEGFNEEQALKYIYE